MNKISSDKPIVVHVVDSGIRDILWRIFLSVELANEGITSVFGTGQRFDKFMNNSSNTLVFGRLPRNEGFSGLNDPLLDLAKKNNTSFLYLHDEGGYYSKSVYRGSVIRSHILQCALDTTVKKIFFWGELQKRIASKVITNKKVRDKFVVVGAPRFDLFHKPYVDIINKMNDATEKNLNFQKYILVCTRGGGINRAKNHPSPLSDKIRNNIKFGTKSLIEVERLMFGKWAKQSIDAIMLIEAISYVSIKFPEESFVVRPHPGESLTFYEDAFDKYKNIKISNNSDLSLAIKSSKLVVGNDCTSGLEAILGGREFINFRPFGGFNEEFSVHGLNKLGQIVKDKKSLVSRVNASINSTLNTNKVTEKLHSQRHIVKNLYSPSIPTIREHIINYCNNSKHLGSYLFINGTIKQRIYSAIKKLIRKNEQYINLNYSHDEIKIIVDIMVEEKFINNDVRINYKDGVIVVSPS